jgi:hypothetical protein
MAYGVLDIDRASTGAPSNGLSQISGYVSTSSSLIASAGIYQHSSQLATDYSDSVGGIVWNRILDIWDSTSQYGIAVFYALNSSGGAKDLIFKCGSGGTGTTPSGSKIGNAIWESSGLHTSSPYTTGEVVSNIQAAPGTGANAVTSGNLPVLATQPGALFTFSVDVTNTLPPTEGTGLTTRQNLWSFGAGQIGTMADRRLTATTAVAGTFTTTNGSDRHITIAAFFNETGALVASASFPMLCGVG